MAGSLSYLPIAEEGEESAERFKSPPIRTWKKFPPTTVERISYFPDSASTPYNARLETAVGISPLRHPRRNPCALSPIDRIKIGAERRLRKTCKSFELNQTCPVAQNKPAAGGVNRQQPQPQDGPVDGHSFNRRYNGGDVSLSSIASSSNPGSSSVGSSYLAISHRHQFPLPRSARRVNMEKIRVDGANGLRFSARRTKGCFMSGTGSPYSSSVVTSSGSTAGVVGGGSGHMAMPHQSNTTTTTTTTTTSDSIMRISKSEINPNKAVFTIDSKTSRILIVNKNACEILGYSSRELCEIEFSDLLVNKSKSHVSALAEGQLNSEDGTLVLLSGKVVEMCTKSGTPLAVSLWIRQIDSDGRCLAVAEPVERRIAKLIINAEGSVISGDYESLLLFQMDSVEEFIGLDVSTLIPAIKLPESLVDDSAATDLPKSIYKQKATGKTKDGLSFPLCLIIDRVGAEGTATCPHFSITIWVFNNLSGLMVLDEAGVIESCNHHFSMLMFGYAQSKIIGQHVSKVIPNFGQELEYVDLGRSRNATMSSLDNEESETETDHVERTDLTVSERLSSAADNVKVCLDFSSSKVNSSMVSELSDDISNIKSLSSDTRSMQGGGGGALAEELPGSAAMPLLAKSVSDNLLCHDENNPNLANNIGGPKWLIDGRGPSNKVGSALDSVCDNTYEDDYSQLMDNEILTPVNETDFFIGSCATTTVDGSTQPAGNSNPSTRNSSRPFSVHTPGGDPSVINTNEMPNTSSRSAAAASKLPTAIGVDSSERFGESSASSGSSSQQQQQQVAGRKTLMHVQDGKYKGEAIHNDGNVIDIIYTVSCQTLPSGRVHCVWVSRDPDTELSRVGKSGEEELEDGEDGAEEDEEERNQNLTLTFDSVNSTVENSLGQAIRATAQSTTAATTVTPSSNPNALSTRGGGGGGVSAAGHNSRPNSMSLLSQCEDELIAGDFSKHYSTLKQIGKGAYGYVKMAYRNADRLLVIAKFILKEKLCPQFMVVAEDKREVPMEIYLLTTVEHPNIVRVLDVFENDKFYQLVMEKHGCGMDLFEFIDRLPMMDEKLACYIFRQIAHAVDYLHSLHILHRDLKDENIIIDQNFHVKLIDFGSATFMEEGKLFSTFYGTTEYCSPEVLAGNKYAGPELEMWSLGVTLYVIMFFENPFVDIEETLHASLVIPQKVSGQLERLLLTMLDKSPVSRCTMRELMADAWLNQEINAALFNFAWVVPCEAYESNPDKYYNGQVLSSGTAISTTSPQDSLSLVDGDSMLDVDGEDGEDEEEAAREPLGDDNGEGGEGGGVEGEDQQLEDSQPSTGMDSKAAASSSGGGPNSILLLPQSGMMNKTTACGSPSTRPILSVNHPTNSVPKGTGPSLIVSDSSAHLDPLIEVTTTTTVSDQRTRHTKTKYTTGDQQQQQQRGGVKRNKRNKQKKRANRKAPLKKLEENSPGGRLGAASGVLALSKSENNLFERGMKFLGEGAVVAGGGSTLSGYDGVVSSMRDLQFDSVGQGPGRAMNDLSKTQVLNTIAVSTEAVGFSTSCACDDLGTGLGEEAGGGGKENMEIRTPESRTPFKQDTNGSWSATVELTPKTTNRSNFQILSISYNHHGDEDCEEEEEECYEDGYENESWDDEEPEEHKL